MLETELDLIAREIVAGAANYSSSFGYKPGRYEFRRDGDGVIYVIDEDLKAVGSESDSGQFDLRDWVVGVVATSEDIRMTNYYEEVDDLVGIIEELITIRDSADA